MQATTRFETAMTMMTDNAITSAGFSLTVIARAEQIPVLDCYRIVLPRGSSELKVLCRKQRLFV
jgi:hypothetical protein